LSEKKIKKINKKKNEEKKKKKEERYNYGAMNYA
jgi:hypothetical protein